MARKKKPVSAGNALALDLRNPRSFDGVTDTRHAVGRTSRSASEAFKDASYAQAVWKCESEFEYAVRFIGDMVNGMFTVFMYLAIPILLVMWLFR
jgi:hypothetical protein